MDRRVRTAKVEAFVLRSPLETPVVTSFGAMRDRPAVLVRIRDKDGVAGWGEAWCNFPAQAAEHRARLVEQVLAPIAEGVAFDDAATVGTVLAQRTRILAIQCAEPGPFAQSIAAIEMAAWDLTARRANMSLWKLLGAADTCPSMQEVSTRRMRRNLWKARWSPATRVSRSRSGSI